MKKCPFCGAELPEEARFCPSCARTLTEPETVSVRVPHPGRKKAVLLLVILILIIAAIILWHRRSRIYDDAHSAQLQYHNYTLVIRNSVDYEINWREPQPSYFRLVNPGLDAAIPLQLYIFDSDTLKNASDAFMDAVDSFDMKVSGGNPDAPLILGEPAYNEAFPLAARLLNVRYSSGSGISEITLTFHMKNRDSLVLHEKIEIRERPSLTVSWEDRDLTTTALVQACIDETKATADPESYVSIQLAPVCYEGDLLIDGLAISLTGSRNEQESTVFEGKMHIRNSQIAATVSDIEFRGPQAGIVTEFPCFILQCQFSQCDVGIYGMDGSWPMPESCTFTDCHIGFEFDSSQSVGNNALFLGNIYKNCDTGILLEQVPIDGPLYFVDHVFENNGTDIDNRFGSQILTEMEEP